MVTSKEEKLRLWMRSQAGVLVAYSGGVDSAYLALIATQELSDRAICVTGVSPSVSSFQLETATRIAVDNGFDHRLLDTYELDDVDYRANRGSRCYFCKKELYKKIKGMGDEEFPGYIILDGSNSDDLGDHRPGRAAALESGVRSPLEEFGITKQDIRDFSLRQNLETWDKPSSPCLSSRVVVGIKVTRDRLFQIEKGEQILRDHGFREFRVRVDGKNARIEIAQSEMLIPGFGNLIDEVVGEIRQLGFNKVELEPAGYRSGSVNGEHVKPSKSALNLNLT